MVLVATGGACSIRWGMVVSLVTGQPIPGASVSLADPFGRIFKTTTDGSGNYRLQDLPVGYYSITVAAPGYIPQTRRTTEDRFAARWQLGEDPAPNDDADGDGLSRAAEQSLGTNPATADTDNDGILDNLEATVLEPLGLPGMGADPRRRDVFVEIDHDSIARGTGSPEVTASMIDQMETVYRNAPLANPDGTTGITPHIDNGQLGGGTAVTVPQGWGCGGSGGYDGVNDLAPERRNVFFHVLSSDLSTCGLYGLAYGNRRVVVDIGQPQLANLQDMVGAGTILHELGHTLGLTHGGDDGLQCKPNYPSVMNYDPVPVFFNGGIDYSRGLQPQIDEAAIDETRSLYTYPNYDWNHNGVIDSVPYAKDVDNFTWLDPALEAIMNAVFSSFRCPLNGVSPTPLHDFDDWTHISQNLGVAVGRPMATATRGPAVIGP